ncbi:FecR family protein [Pedobacter panaciterrae]|uniref:FecR domain-containing protein n=1 Tax=Pedobacter panaciterrae TaxID=363849 RepID=A0ABU8NHY7_9SPHI|nr:FecR family protein [Pedobacter panaciterrae]NQX53835.1 FecR family protein [Pedobacter panaciterrae]
MDAKNKKEIYKEFGISDPSEFFEDQDDKEQLRKEMLARITASRYAHDKQSANKQKRISKKLMLAMAAAISFVLLSAGIVFYYNSYFKANDFVIVKVPMGKTQLVTLPDGSTVWLNAASTLKYPKKFGAKRIVYLEDGEGFFNVVHNEKVPFIVESSSLKTFVLGTSFVVKSYKSLSTASVSVVTGKVAVSNHDKQISVLTPNQEVVYNKVTHKPKTLTTKAVEKTEWNNGKVNLNGVYFEEAVLAVENAYGVKIDYDKELFKNCQNTFNINAKQSLKETLDLIALIQGITYQIKEKEVLITGNGCN